MKTILVVDDEQCICQMIEDALSREYKVACAKNGRAAQALMAEQQFDLVIADLVMPEMNGIDLLMSLHQTQPNQKLIAISGGGGINGRFDYLPVAQLISGCTTLRKPFSINDLRGMVKALLT